MKLDNKLLELLTLVVEMYISKGDPIGSKFLNSLEDVQFAPSTLRKYLNHLEHEGLLYQPYSSAWRVPTSEWLEMYIENIISTKQHTGGNFKTDLARNSLKWIVETLGDYVDGVVVWFLKNDEYYYLGINNLLRQDLIQDYKIIKEIISYIETKQIIATFIEKEMDANRVWYYFIQQENSEDENYGMISVLYVKITVWWYDGVLAILGPTRVNYRKNLTVLRHFLDTYWI